MNSMHSFVKLIREEMADTELDIKKLKVADLKKELSSRGLITKGSKQELVDRLQEHLNQENQIGDDEDDDDVLAEDEIENEIEDNPTEMIDQEGVEVDTSETANEKTEEKNIIHTAVTSKKIISSISSDADLLKKRAERFGGSVSADAKKQARIDRFGIVDESDTKQNSSVLSGDIIEKIKKRADRFGTNVSSSAVKIEQEEKLKKRKERFGISLSSNPSNEEAKKAKRAEKFGGITSLGGSNDAVLDDKRKKRAERFGL